MYVAWYEYDPTASRVAEIDGWATPSVPEVTNATLPAITDVPVQLLAVEKNVKSTVPVGAVMPFPDTVARSCTVVPRGTEVTTASEAL